MTTAFWLKHIKVKISLHLDQQTVLNTKKEFFPRNVELVFCTHLPLDGNAVDVRAVAYEWRHTLGMVTMHRVHERTPPILVY